jgi:glycosyltransferase involved in cell wall biosynthesis
MRIVCISSSQVPSDTANSIQVMKVCQAFAQLGNEVLLLVPGPQTGGLDLAALQQHYGLRTKFNIEWLSVRSRRVFLWASVRRAHQVGAELVYAWPLQSAVFSLLRGMSTMVELHDYPNGIFGWYWLHFWLRLFLIIPGRKRLLPITEALRRVLSLPEKKTIIAPDGVDLERYSSLPEAESARRLLGLPGILTVLCSGHLYEGRGAALFLELARIFPQASFVWVGGRPEEVKTWATRAGEQSLTNVTFTGFIPNERIPLYQAAADILIMPYERTIATSSGGNTAQVCSPMKMFEYMAAGRAILSSDLPVLREVLNETNAVFCPPEDTRAWETALRILLVDTEQRQVLGKQAQGAVQKYSWTERTKRVLQGFFN